MSKKPGKAYKQTQVCCGKELKWVDCGHRANVGCPDCGGAGGWWEECDICGNQPYYPEELFTPEHLAIIEEDLMV